MVIAHVSEHTCIRFSWRFLRPSTSAAKSRRVFPAFSHISLYLRIFRSVSEPSEEGGGESEFSREDEVLCEGTVSAYFRPHQ